MGPKRRRPHLGVRGELVSGGVLLLAALVLGTAPALASSTTRTLSGDGADGYSPDSVSARFDVKATLSQGVAGGTLTTLGKVGGNLFGEFVEFDGSVTCMTVLGDRVVVGAFGSLSHLPPGPQPQTPLAGMYAQILTVELGRFTDPFAEESQVYDFRFGMLGKHGEGIGATAPPDCQAAVFAPEDLPTGGGTMQLVSSPGPSTESGYVAPIGVVVPSSGGNQATTTTVANESGQGQHGATPAQPARARTPLTKVTSVKVSGRRVRITFRGVDDQAERAGFRCRLDGARARRCASPLTLLMKPGRHLVSVSSLADHDAFASPASSVAFRVTR